MAARLATNNENGARQLEADRVSCRAWSTAFSVGKQAPPSSDFTSRSKVNFTSSEVSRGR